MSMPDYLRVSNQQKDPSDQFPERITIISKANGWLTVNSKTVNRRQAFEKEKSKLVVRETSPLSPSWMQNVNTLKPDLETRIAFRK